VARDRTGTGTERALVAAGIDCDEVLAAARAAFAGGKRRSTILELDSVSQALGREYGVDLEPFVTILALDDKVFRTAYQLSVRGGGQLTLVRLRLPPRKRVVLAHLSERPDRRTTPDHDTVAAALTFVDFSFSFRAIHGRLPTLEERAVAGGKRSH